MATGAWRTLLVACLAVNAVTGVTYRIYRLTKKGPLADVIGQAILGVLLALVALGIAFGLEWLRWVALGYAILFALVVMPLWVLAVLIPLRPRAADYAFTAIYWFLLVLTGVAAVLL